MTHNVPLNSPDYRPRMSSVDCQLYGTELSNSCSTRISHRLHMYCSRRDTGGNPEKLSERRKILGLRISVMELCAPKLECKFESNLRARSVGSWQSRGNTTRLSHICHAHPREAQQAANTKVFITLHPLLFITRIITKKIQTALKQSPTNPWWGSRRSRLSRRMKCPHWLAAPLSSPQHSPPIDSREISSRQPLTLWCTTCDWWLRAVLVKSPLSRLGQRCQGQSPDQPQTTS